MQLNPGQILKDRQRYGGTSGADYNQFNKIIPRADVRRPFERSASLGIASAGGQADQSTNDFLANGGGRFGAGGSFLAGAARSDMMRPAQADAAQLRAQGTLAQNQSDNERMQMIQSLLALKMQERMQKEQISAQQKQALLNSLGPLLSRGLLNVAGAQANYGMPGPGSEENGRFGGSIMDLFKQLGIGFGG